MLPDPMRSEMAGLEATSAAVANSEWWQLAQCVWKKPCAKVPHVSAVQMPPLEEEELDEDEDEDDEDDDDEEAGGTKPTQV